VSNGPLGILGGTFNPIHNGHLRSALELRELLDLQQLLLVPAAVPPLREAPEVAAAARADMVELALAGERALACDRRELSRPGPSYTYDTLAELRREEGAERSLCLVLGTDTLEQIERWHRWRELLDLAHLVVLARPGWRSPESGAVGDWINENAADGLEALHGSPCGRILALELRQLPISATEIRGMIAAGKSPRYLLPDSVWDYIQRTGAYGAGPELQEQHGIA
jgi:nicotinate-nucleotide adenylyltransferase